jgi:DNA-binding CsgD family transcriptional regulator/HD-GYP domain-containing protein (c-di-GMP phosphodiesterase class II)
MSDITLPSSIPRGDALTALAIVGDLSMGQPIDHSARTSRLARRLSFALGVPESHVQLAEQVALLRWCGCTGNAVEFAELLGDDVHGRQSLLSSAFTQAANWTGPRELEMVTEAVRIHCDVANQVVSMLGLDAQVSQCIPYIFDLHPPPASEGPALIAAIVNAAGDYEIFERESGPRAASRRLHSLSGVRHPEHVVAALLSLADRFKADTFKLAMKESSLESEADHLPVELLGSLVDIKVPWMAGFSRRVAELAFQAWSELGRTSPQPIQLYRAGLLHGLGRAAVPNHVWNNLERSPSAAADEYLRLVPYWTQRVGEHVASIRVDTQLASQAFERPDGTGYFRGACAAPMPAQAQVLALAVDWGWRATQRPDGPLAAPDALARTFARDHQGVFAGELIAAILGAAGHGGSATAGAPTGRLLSRREVEVLREVSLGKNSKEVAQALAIAPGTVRTHMEKIFDKLECRTRAAALLRASTLGLL